jgi:hypothetical protein
MNRQYDEVYYRSLLEAAQKDVEKRQGVSRGHQRFRSCFER